MKRGNNEGEKKLEVRGAGYGPPPRPTRGPFVMPSQKRTASASRVAMAPTPTKVTTSTTSTSQSRTVLHSRFGSSSNIAQQQVCSCQHPADLSFLQDIYVNNLRMKNEMLELQNRYLQTMSKGEHYGDESKPDDRDMRGARVGKKVVFSGESAEHRQKMGDQELFNQLEDAYRRENEFQERIKSLVHEVRKVTVARDEALERLQTFEGGSKSLTEERRNLMEDNVELQRRLDDLTPLLADKDAEIARLEAEKAILLKRIRQTPSRSPGRHGSLEKRNEEVMIGQAKEIRRMESRAHDLDVQLRESRRRETQLEDEISALHKKLKEGHSSAQSDVVLRRNLTDENNKLIKENTQLTSKMSRLEQLVEKQRREIDARSKVDITETELRELRDSLARLKSDLSHVREQNRVEVDLRRRLEEQMREQEKVEEEEIEGRAKLREELEALKVLSNSLSAENQGLREEKLTQSERMDVLYQKLEDSDKEIMWLARRLEEFRRHYFETIERLQMEIKRQSDASSELEEIVKKAHQLSASFPRRSRHIQTVTTTATRREASGVAGEAPPGSARSTESSSSKRSVRPGCRRPDLSPVHHSPTGTHRLCDNGMVQSTQQATTSTRSNRSLVTLRSSSLTHSSAADSDLMQKYRRKNS